MSIDPYQKYWDEWYAYEQQMKRPKIVKDHNFVDFKCLDCDTTSKEVASGMKSWVCFGTSMSCCGNVGIAKWDHFTLQWRCSRCNAILSNDPHYSGSNNAPSWSLPAVTKDDPFIPKRINDSYIPKYIEHKCTCGAHAVSSNSHSLWCDWRPSK